MSPNPFLPLATDSPPPKSRQREDDIDMEEVYVEETPPPDRAPTTPAQTKNYPSAPSAPAKGSGRDKKRPASPSYDDNGGPAKNKPRFNPPTAPYKDANFAEFEKDAEFARTRSPEPSSPTPTPTGAANQGNLTDDEMDGDASPDEDMQDDEDLHYSDDEEDNDGNDQHDSGPQHHGTQPRPRQVSPSPPVETPLRPRGQPTPAPEGGWEAVDGISIEGLLMDVDPEQRIAWLEAGGHKLMVWAARARRLAIDEAQARILSAIIAILPPTNESSIIVSPPIPDPANDNAAPIGFLVTGMTLREYRLLTSSIAWSLPEPEDLTLFVAKFDDPLSPFNHTTEGFTYGATPAAAHLIREGYAGAIATSPQTKAFIAAHNDAIHPRDGRSFIEEIVNSVQAKPMRVLKRGTNNIWTVQWNIYVQSPTHDLELNVLWRKLVADFTFRTALYGIGQHIAYSWSCSICQSASHPAGLCPFPRAPGWNGPTATSAQSPPPPAPTQGPSRHIHIPGSASPPKPDSSSPARSKQWPPRTPVRSGTKQNANYGRKGAQRSGRA